MPIKKELIYPVMLECVQFTENTFWKNIFEDLAYGDTPYGTYIKQNFLTCGFKDKEFSYKIEENKNPEIIYKDIYGLLHDKLGILSYEDKINKKIHFNKIENEIKKSHKEWGTIKKKNIKDTLIECYAINMKNKHNLTIKQTKYLLSLIFIAMIFKVIKPTDILYENNKISHIDGFVYENKKIIFKKKLYNFTCKFTPEIIIDTNLLSDEWTKYINNLSKLTS